MGYDLLITNGRIVDGSGAPAFFGDVAVQGGRIVGIGKLSAAATLSTAGSSRPVRVSP